MACRLFAPAGGLPDPDWLIQVLPEITFPDGCAQLTRRPVHIRRTTDATPLDHRVPDDFV